MNRSFWLFILAIMVAGYSQAQPYIGGAIGYGDSKFVGAPAQHSSVQASYDYDSAIWQGFAGYRSGWLAVEAGITRLPTFKGTADISDYPAYKPCTLGPGCPPTARGVQRIDAKALYLRGNAYLPRVAGVEPYAFAGIAISNIKNEGYATYAGYEPDTSLSYRYSVKTSLYGFGLQFTAAKNLLGRVEATFVPTFSNEQHTGKRDAYMVTAGVLYQF